MVSEPNFISAAEFWKLSHHAQYADKSTELIRGIIVEKPLASGLHGVVKGNIGGLLYNQATEIGTLMFSTGYVLFTNADTIRRPDVSFVRNKRFPHDLPDGYLNLAPDLAVEVIDVHDTFGDLADRIQDYLEVGTLLIWLVNPRSSTTSTVFSIVAVRDIFPK